MAAGAGAAGRTPPPPRPPRPPNTSSPALPTSGTANRSRRRTSRLDHPDTNTSTPGSGTPGSGTPGSSTSPPPPPSSNGHTRTTGSRGSRRSVTSNVSSADRSTHSRSGSVHSAHSGDNVPTDPSRYSTSNRLKMLLRRGANSARSLSARSDTSRHSAAYSDDGSGQGGGGKGEINDASTGGGGGERILEWDTTTASSSAGGSAGGKRTRQVSKKLRMPEVPSAALGLQWSKTASSLGSSSSSEEDSTNVDKHRRKKDPNYHDPNAIHRLDSSGYNLKDDEDGGEQFVPSAPQCRNVDEAMFALHELLCVEGRSPYDEEEDLYALPMIDGDAADGSGVDYDWLLDGDYGAAANDNEDGDILDEDCARMLAILYPDGDDNNAAAVASSTSSIIDEATILGLELKYSRTEEDHSCTGNAAADIYQFASFDSETAKEQLCQNGEGKAGGDKDGDDDEEEEEEDGSDFGSFVVAADALPYSDVAPEDKDEPNADTDNADGKAKEDTPAEKCEPKADSDDADECAAAGDTAFPVAAENLQDEDAKTPPRETETGNVANDENEEGASSSSSSSSSRSEKESLHSSSEEEDDAPPILLDLAIGRSADFLRSLPLAEPTSQESRFVRRTQLRLIRQAERGTDGGGDDNECMYDSDDESYSDDASDGSSLRTDEGEEDGDGEPHHTESSNGEDLWWRRSASEIERSLPEEFFSDASDPTLTALLAVPWDERPPTDPAYVHGARASFDKMEPYDEYFSRKLSELDQAHRRVTKRLVSRIHDKTGALERGLKRVQDLDLDIARAHLDAEAGASCLRRARGAADEADRLEGAGGLLGGLCVIQDADTRDRLRSLCSIIEDVDGLIRTEAALMVPPSLVEEYQERIHSAVELKESVLRLGGGRLARLECLGPLRDRVGHITVHLASQMKESLAMIIGNRCEKIMLPKVEANEAGSSLDLPFTRQYANLLHSRLILAKHEKLEHAGIEPILLNWSEGVVDSLCFEIDKCIVRALLDPTDTAQDSEDLDVSEYANDLLHLRHQASQIHSSDEDGASKLRIVLHNLLTIRFDFEDNKNVLPWVYHKLCVLIAEVMQVHYVLKQWHSTSPDEDQCSGESTVQSPPSQDMSWADLQRRIEESDSQEWSLASLSGHLRDSRLKLWQQCQSVFVKLLEQYLAHTAKKKAVQGKSSDESGGEGKWAVQLEGLHDMWQLTNQMVLLGNNFAGDDQGINEEWNEKLSQIFRGHLRGVHVEAMNTMGAILAHETWMLLPTQIDSAGGWKDHKLPSADSLKPGYEVKDALKAVLDSLCPLHFVDSRVLASSGRRSWENRLQDRSCAPFEEKGNPFLKPNEQHQNEGVSPTVAPSTSISSDEPAASLSCSQPATKSSLDVGDSIAPQDALYASIAPFVVQDPTGQRVLSIATQGSMNGLGKWTARLIKIMKKLPIIAEDATNVISNLFDMYLLTVLRMCAGNEANERVLLGITSDSADTDKEESGDSPGKVGHLRKSSYGSGSPLTSKKVPLQPANPISQTTDADICAPLSCEIKDMVGLQDFVRRGHESLSGMVNLRMVEKWDAVSGAKGPSDPKREAKDAAGILERQISAATSCLYAAALLDVALARLKASTDSEKMDAFATYAASVVDIAPALTSLASRISCVRAAKGRRTVLEVMMVGSAWKDSRFSEHYNDYVDDMCLRSARLWDNLSSSPHKLPAYALSQTWQHIVEGSFLSLLEGFSKIIICSMEGRALMSMDLATYYAGINPAAVENRLQDIFRVSPDPPPAISTNKGMQYVDAYIKAFYYPEEDMQNWIEEHHKSYHMRHMIGLISCAAAGNGWKARKVDELQNKVEALYIITE